MTLGTVTYAAKDGIARAVLNRPEQMNAISPDLLEDLDGVCTAVEGDATVRVLTVTASGRTQTFDSFECAIHSLAPACAHCGCKVIGHGAEAGGKIYCCAHCAKHASAAGLSDRA